MADSSYSPGDLVRHASDALIAVDLERRVLSMNPSAEALTGYSEAEAVGRPCAEVLRSSVCNDACPFERAFHNEEQVTTFDVRVHNRNDEEAAVCINTSVLKNDRGEKIGLVESIRNIERILELIQEREDARSDVERIARQLEAVLETSDDAVITVNLNCEITSFNAAAERLMGYSREEVLGVHPRKICHTEFCPLEVTILERRALPGSELNLRVRDGRTIPVWMKTELLRNQKSEVIGAVVIHRDQREVRQLRERFRDTHGLDRLIGKSAPMLDVYQRIEQVAPTDSTVLILGESGTGKELVAEILHSRSRRWDQPFVKVNCAALPATLLETELFGHKKGAFTGAVSDRIGRFQLAHGGTIFLDEIGDLPLPLQVKLLRVLQERQVERVGSTKTEHLDLRILAATNRDLTAMVQSGEFREDLYYRLNVVPVNLPPLRSHPVDITLLAQNFLAEMADRDGKPPKQLTPQALKVLMDYDWPGNVRELENALEYGVVTCQDDWLRASDLPPRLLARDASTSNGSLAAAVDTAEKDALLTVIHEAPSSHEAARRLGISRATLWRKMKRLGVSYPRTASQT